MSDPRIMSEAELEVIGRLMDRFGRGPGRIDRRLAAVTEERDRLRGLVDRAVPLIRETVEYWGGGEETLNELIWLKDARMTSE